MIPTLYLRAGIAALITVAGFYAGSQHEHRTHIAREAVAAARIEAARAKLQTAFDAVAAKQAQAAVVQTQTFTEIRRVASPIVYRNVAVCADADDASLLDRARNAANSSALARELDGGSAAAASVSPQR